MNSTGRKTIVLIGILLLLLTCWAIGNLLNAYPYVFTGGEKTPDLIAPASESGGSDGSTVVQFPFKIAFYIFISSLVVASAAAVYEFTKDKEEAFEMGVKLLGYVFGGIVFIIMLKLLPFIKSFTSIFPGGTFYYANYSNTLALLIPIVILMLIVYIYIFKKANTYVVNKLKTEKEKLEGGMREKITSDVEETIDELHQGKDVRSTIIRSYQRMCNTLEERGLKDNDSMTPREFRRLAVKKLRIDSSIISDMTKTFEEARYSVHELGDEDRRRALSGLNKLKKEIGGGI